MKTLETKMFYEALLKKYYEIYIPPPLPLNT